MSISYATSASSNKRPSVMRVGKNWMSDLIDGSGGYPGDYPGVTYFVNNITGSSTNDGLTWNTAFDQVSTAITASEASRVLPSGTTNDYIRNRIFIQGTGTLYTYLTAVPNHCDVIGIGADPKGNDSGIVRIGTNSAAVDGVTGSGSTTDMRGTVWANIQFNAGNGSYYAFDAPQAFRGGWYNCWFGTHSSASAAPVGGLRIVTGSGITIKECGTMANIYLPVTGLTVGNSGGNFSQCIVEDCVWSGSTQGILNSAYLCNWTVFRNNFVYGATYGIRDTSTETTIAGNAWYINNFIASADAISIASTGNGAYQCLGNFVSDTAEGHIETNVYTLGTT